MSALLLVVTTPRPIADVEQHKLDLGANARHAQTRRRSGLLSRHRVVVMLSNVPGNTRRSW
jgi:hypothetical protein